MADPTPPPDLPDGHRPDEPGPVLGPGAVEFLTLGLTIAVTLVVCGALGYLLDRWLGTSPAFILVGIALGIAVSAVMIVSMVRKYL